MLIQVDVSPAAAGDYNVSVRSEVPLAHGRNQARRVTSVFYEDPCRVCQILKGSGQSYRNLRTMLCNAFNVSAPRQAPLNTTLDFILPATSAALARGDTVILAENDSDDSKLDCVNSSGTAASDSP